MAWVRVAGVDAGGALGDFRGDLATVAADTAVERGARRAMVAVVVRAATVAAAAADRGAARTRSGECGKSVRVVFVCQRLVAAAGVRGGVVVWHLHVRGVVLPARGRRAGLATGDGNTVYVTAFAQRHGAHRERADCTTFMTTKIGEKTEDKLVPTKKHRTTNHTNSWTNDNLTVHSNIYNVLNFKIKVFEQKNLKNSNFKVKNKMVTKTHLS